MKTITSNRSTKLPVVLTLCCIGALVLTTVVSSKAPKSLKAGKAKETVRMFDLGLGPHRFNFELGRETDTQYLGSDVLQQALQAGQFQPRTLVSDDFNGDGMGDLVIGYANNGAGALGVRQGNVQAIAPSDPSVFQGITEGRYPSPFLPEVKLYSLPEAPDFLQFGDFNSDGYSDVMAAARGGQRMYLLAGDGRGNLGDPQSFEAPGLITEMHSATEQRGTFTQLAVGLSAPGGAQLAVYDKTEDLDGGPESYSMTGEVMGLAFDDLDGDGITDLAAATSSEVVVIHGRSAQPIASVDSETKSTSESTAAVKSVFIERQNVHFAIRGLATGNFAFDRNHQREIALLSDDGTVYLSALGTPDTRPFTKAEKEAISKLRRSFALNKIDMETLTAETNKFVRPNRGAGWNVAETMRGTSAYTGTGKALFQRSNASRRGIDELLIGDGINHTVEVIKSEREAAKLRMEGRQQASDPEAVSVAGAPIAAVSMRLTVGGKEGLVLLAANNVEPTVDLVAPDRTFTVNSTADLPDSTPTAANGVCQASNGLCTLRAAVMQSNHSGGANAIMVPDNTYTLTLGPPDDEANTGGALEQSGDLDIFSWDAFTGEPILTQVTITGGTRDGCIIQMGNLVPTLGTNSPNNKERILQVNDGAVGAGAQKIDVALTNLTMQNGVSPTGSGTFLDGGAVRFDGFDFSSNTNVGLLILNNVKLTNNTSAGAGGGVFAGFGSLTIENSSIVRANTALNKIGGGVAWTGGNTVETQGLTITNSTIGGAAVGDGNLATHNTFGAGAGVDARGGAFVTVQTNTVIRNNVASVDRGSVGGGGIQINSPIVAFSLSEISDNKCKHNGGGIYSSARNAVTNAPSTITLTDVDVLRNQADSDSLEDPGPGTGFGDGGGIFNYFGSMTIQTNSHIDGNSAYDGGGIFSTWTFIPADFTASLTVQSGSTIGQVGAGLGNSARNNGGSLNINPTGAPNLGTINLNSLTFANSTANSDNIGGGDGGAIFIGAGAINSLNSCTFDGNIVNGSGTGDGIRQTGGTITGAGTLNFNGGDSISLSGGTFTSTSGTLNLTGNLLNSGGSFAHNNGTVVFNGSAAQSIGGSTAITFNNLIINNSNGVSANTASTASTGTLTLTLGALAPNAGTTFTVNGPVSFTSGTFNANTTSTVNYAKSTNVQNIAPGNYGNLTFSNFTKTLPNGATVKIAGTFTTGATGGHTITGSTVEFNGTGAQTLPSNFTTYNNLTLNNTGAGVTGFAGLIVQSLLRVQAGTFTSSSTYNDVQIDSGATLAGVNLTTINVTGNWTNNGTFTPNGNTVNFNGGAAQILSGTPTSQIFNHFTITKGGGALSTSGGTTSLDINGNLTIAAGTFTAPAAITLAGNFSQATGTTFTPGSGTVTFDGSGAQSILGTLGTKAFFNFAVNKSGGSTLSAAASTTALDINGNVILTAGTFAAGTAATTNVAGNWTNNGGTFTPGTGTVIFDGGAGQTIGGTNATTFNSLTNSNANGLAMSHDNTVGGVLALTSSDITVAATKILTMPATGSSTGTFDVIGSVKRTGFVSGGSALSFGNPFNTIKIDSGAAPTDIVVNLAKAAPVSFPGAVTRTYGITPNGGSPSATLRLHYLDSELNGNVESQLDLWRFNGVAFVDEQRTGASITDNWVEKSGVTAFSDWTLATHVNQAPSITPNPASTVVNTQTSAIVLDRQAVDTAFVTHFKITGITNGELFKSDGLTEINNNDFITYAEGNAGLKFTPALNSLAQGSFNVQASSDAIGTGLSPTATAIINVNQGTTTITITSDLPDPSNVGQIVTVNYSVALATGNGTPTGTVTVTISGGAETCNGTVAAGTCDITLTTAGNRTLTATYSGDSNFIGDDDTEAHQVIGPPVAVDDNYVALKDTTLNVPAPGVIANDSDVTEVTAIVSGTTTAGGTVTLNTDGSFTYTPLAGYTGPDSFTYEGKQGALTDTATVNITVAEAFFINEVLFNPTGTNAPNEYIEFRGPASAVIPAGTYFVAIEGDTAENPGDVQTIINLSGLSFGSNGFLVLLQNGETYTTDAGANVITSTTTGFGGLPGSIWSADAAVTDIEHDSVTFMIIQAAVAPTLTDEIDADDDATPDGSVFSGWAVLDSIGVLDGTVATDVGYGALTFVHTTGGQVDPPNTAEPVAFPGVYVGRNGDSTGSTAASDWVATGALGGAAPNWTVGASPEPAGFANKPLNHIGSTNFELVAPTVVSITRADANPTNASSVDFTVTFSESVTGVDATDFDLTTTGTIAGASIGLIGAAGNIYTVTVNTGTGDGTIRLDLDDDDTIVDNSLNPLGGAGAQDFTTGEVYTVDKTVPTVDITDVTPDPRNTNVSSISIVFSEAISGFDLADLSLTRNGGANLLTGSQTLTSGDNINWTLGNLGALTDPDGNYVLTLTAAGAGITDDASNALATGATDDWVMDGSAPTVDITDVTPDPRNTSVTSISIVFSEDVSGFDLGDLTLTRNGGANLLTGAQTLTSGDNINWTLGNLSGLTGTDGTYLLTLTGPGGITDGGGNPLASGATDTWVMDTAAPTVDITNVTPDPRNTSVSSISIVFSEAITGFDLADLSLTRDGGANLLTGSQTLTSADNITWTLGNLSTLTGADGNYDLTLTSGGIADPAGNALAGGASDTWIVNGAPPTVDITDVTPDPRNTSVSSISIVFSEAITGFDLADLSLTRNGGANLLTGAQTLTSGDDINWTLGNLSGLTATGGTYLLTLTAPGGITDAGGASLGTGATDTWVMDTTVPTVNITDVTPDPRNTSVSSISIVFSEAITGFDLADLSLTRDGGANLLTGSQTLTSGDNITWTLGNLSTLTGADGNYDLTLTSGGIADPAGNALAAGASDTWVVNGAPPTVDIVDVTPDPRNTAVSSISIVFSEAINGFDLADLSLKRNGGANLLTGAQTLSSGDNITWTLGNLSGLTGTSGSYTLTLTAPGGITDAGGASLGTGASDTWVMDATGPTVTINQASGQADPTSTSPINFTVVFNEAVTNFINTDVSLSGTAGATTAVVTEIAPNNDTTYNVAVSGMTSSGTVIASLAAGVASDTLGNLSQASTSTDNTVTFNLILNSAPVLDNTGNMTLAAINEDVANASNPGTLVSAIIASAGGNRITDTDAGAVEGIAVVAANNANGTWEYSINNGTNWTAFGSPGATTARLLAANASTRVRFVPNANFNGSVAAGLTFRAWDQFTGTNGGTANVSTNGGQTAFSTATETAAITVNPVNDAPTANAQAVATNESTAKNIVLTGSDLETASGGLTFTVTVQPTNGVLSGTAPNLTYTPNADFSGADSFKFTVTDTGDGASAALTSAEATVSITVNGVNDAPVNTKPGTQTTPRNTALTFSAGNGNLISIADIDAGSNPLQLTLTATNGTVSLNGTAGLVFTTGNGVDDATMVFTGTIANINARLNGLVFTPTAGFTGTAQLQIITNDQGNTGSGGAKSDTDAVNITVTSGGLLKFSAATYSVAENAGPATITITRSGGSTGTATVLLQTSHGTAGAADYTTVSQTVTFIAGDVSETVNIPINNDTSNEGNETVNLTLSNAGGSGALGSPASAVLTITDNDSVAFSFSLANYAIAENGLHIDITVNRSGDPSVAASVDYATSDQFGLLACTTSNGKASDRCDYLPALGTLNFAASQTSRTFRVFVSDDVRAEGAEVLTLTLSAPVGGALGATSTATLTINDHVVAPGAPNPIDDPAFFIRMLYVDILSREPDTIGFQNWLATLNGCPNGGFGNTNPTCDRVHVAKSFFHSLEFGERGYFVYRFHDAGLGQRPAYKTFLRGMQQIGGALSPADSDAAKMEFVGDFIASAEFQAIYAGLLVPAQANAFITKLEQTSGISIPEPTRSQLVTEMANGTKSPARTLRAFIETEEVFEGFYNRGFVSMLYFGYLHRDPDTIGFNNWLQTLNQTSDFRHLTFGFIYSHEYRGRFGQP